MLLISHSMYEFFVADKQVFYSFEFSNTEKDFFIGVIVILTFKECGAPKLSTK